MNSFLQTVESQSLNAVVAGFSFASAIAWMDVVRWVIANLIKVNKSSGSFTVLTAVLTTVLSIVVYMLLIKLSPDVKQPESPIYAVTR
jgi:uncharacterized membrane protein YkvI